MAEQDPDLTAQLATADQAARRVLRRFVDRDTVDDLAQETLERVFRQADRLDSAVLVPYAAVVARNLAITHARSISRGRRAAHRLGADEHELAADPAELSEVREAVSEGLGRLAEADRETLLAAAEQEPPTGEPAAPASRARLRRLRARARVHYLLAYRKVELPTSRCWPVLMSLSLGDTRAQERTRAADHLLRCPTCSELAEPLLSRRSDLAIFAFPLVAMRWAWGKAKGHPGASAGVATGTAAAAAAVAAIVASQTPAHHAAVATTTPAPTHPVLPTLLTAGGMALPTDYSLRQLTGQQVAGQVAVEEVVSHNGFWVGTSDRNRVWVQLVGPLSNIQLDDGDVVRLQGAVQPNAGGYPSTAGVTNPAEAEQLASQGGHLDVDTRAISLVKEER